VTLVELLVSMMILAAVMGLVGQAVSQVERIVRVADESQQMLSERWGAGWSLQLMFANLVAPREGGGTPFRGGANRIEGYATSALLDSGGGVRRFELILRPAYSREGYTEMLYSELDPSGREFGDGQVVAMFPGRVGFDFRDRRAQWRNQWPSPGNATEGAQAERLPSAVRVAGIEGKELFISYPVLASGSLQRLPSGSPFGNVDR
jgi:hypothetical protein